MQHRLDLGLGDHPWLLVSARHLPSTGVCIGDPWTYAAMRESFGRAVNRLAADFPGRDLEMRKENGTTLHGTRHLYGTTLDRLGIRGKVIQKAMHHKSINSSIVYTQPTAEEAHEEFEAGVARASAKGASFFDPRNERDLNSKIMSELGLVL